MANFFKGSFSEAASSLQALCRRAESAYYVSINAYSLYWAQRDPEYRAALKRADISSADGASVFWASKLLGNAARERLAGYDLALHMLEWAWRENIAVEFVGLRPLVLGKAKRMLESRYPGLRVRTRCVGFTYGRLQELQTAMEPGPRLVLAAFPQPQQEKWIAANLPKMPGALVMGVGGAFETLTGEIRRAPAWIQKAGLEWLFRFLQQPHRRWRKTLISTAWFAAYFMRAYFNKKSDRARLWGNSALGYGDDSKPPFAPN